MVHYTVVLEVVSGSRVKMNHLRDAPQNLSRPYSPFPGIFLRREGDGPTSLVRGEGHPMMVIKSKLRAWGSEDDAGWWLSLNVAKR